MNGLSRAAVAVWVTIGTLAVIAGIVIGGWQASWWFAGQDANRSVQVQHNGVNYQSTLHDQIASKYQDVLNYTSEMQAHPDQAPGLKAARANEAGTVCADMSQISSSDPLDAGQQSWYRQNCDGADLSPSSVYYVTGGM